MPLKAGSPTVPVPGYQVGVVDAEGNHVDAGAEGNIVIKLPLPPGTLAGLWRDEERYRSSYLAAFPGYYLTGDSGYLDEDGYVFVLGRSDDVINVAGHRLSTGSIEAVVASHPAIAECAVIGIHDDLKGQRPSGYVVLKSGVEIDPEDLRGELVAMVRNEIGAVATFPMSPWCPHCRRRARARSCARRCARSPITRSTRCPQLSKIPTSSRHWSRSFEADAVAVGPPLRCAGGQQRVIEWPGRWISPGPDTLSIHTFPAQTARSGEFATRLIVPVPIRRKELCRG